MGHPMNADVIANSRQGANPAQADEHLLGSVALLPPGSCSIASHEGDPRHVDALYAALIPVAPLLGPLSNQVSVAIIEATLNVVEHAFEGLQCNATYRLIAALDEHRRELHISIVDNGMGIPSSLRSQGLASGTDAHAGIWSDQDCVRLALSGIGMAGRGQGFACMRGLIDSLPGSSLVVISADGACTYTCAGIKQTLGIPHHDGTIVQLRLPTSSELVRR